MSHACYRVSPHALIAPLEDGAVLLHLRTKRYYSLNATGAVIWEMLEQGAAGDDIVRRLLSDFEVSEEEAAAGLASLTAELVREEMLERVEPAPMDAPPGTGARPGASPVGNVSRGGMAGRGSARCGTSG